MSIGFFIWLAFALGVSGFVWWSIRVQMMQKKAWKAFASKYNLDFQENRFLQAPKMEGFLKDYYIRLYEGEEFDVGGRKKRSTIIEADIRHELPFNVVITKRAEQVIFQEANLPIRLKYDDVDGWDKTNLVGTDNEDLARAWLADERLIALENVLSMPKAKTALFGLGTRVYIISQTAEPLIDPRHIGQILKRIVDALEILEVPDFLEEGMDDFIDDNDDSDVYSAEDEADKPSESKKQDDITDDEDEKEEINTDDSSTDTEEPEAKGRKSKRGSGQTDAE